MDTLTGCLVSDLHGDRRRYHALLAELRERPADVLLLGGDLLPPLTRPDDGAPDGFAAFLTTAFARLRDDLGPRYPQTFWAPGNDDRARDLAFLARGEEQGLWSGLHGRCRPVGPYWFCGYGCTPPSPFLLKDWERYDVSRFVDPGCVPPEEGQLTVPLSMDELRDGTIELDLQRLVEQAEAASPPIDFRRAVFLFHAPPYDTCLDRADLDGAFFDHAPLDVHIGSIAIRRFIERRRPLLALHGHVHEAPRLTGSWRQQLGDTVCLTAAHDGPELALVRFDLPGLERVERTLAPLSD